MPAYTNISDEYVTVVNSSGAKQMLAPGASIETLYFHDDARLREDNPEPYWEKEVAADTVTLSSTAKDVNIHADARRVFVHKITDSVTVRRNHDNAIPILEGQTSSMPIFFIAVDGIPGRTRRFRVTGSGTCRIVQFRKE